ncbi:sodium:solute symporter family protein [Prochlorococcus marinus]|uniref:Sodium:proline symporter n=1 Tax=Prochlorococcus marinus XMU1408 TaxID=2213228 RepID=A0A318R3B1_PROMR|nr:sodium:solute symporter family protein [Prochlorococcus marinus]MBW3042655.1 sodium:proline symporter [Prochlorococcus marinus str. XMU1408]PYE01350.1 sodium:proline symporter [Prochlorococcus marinus XMU1408]
MTFIDWFILFLYLIFSLGLGIYISLKNNDEADYFVAGRRLNGLLAGMSMAATTFSIDTPLYVAGIIGTRGLAGNWEWWSFGLAHVAMTVIFAPLWRRSGVLTDAAFTELRYGGQAAAYLRGIKAFLLSVPINCIGIGYAFLAMRKVAEAFGVVDGHIVFGIFTDTIFLMILVALFLLIYTVLGGLWAVVVNDFVQLLLALLGAFAVSYVALDASGGMNDLLFKLEALDRPELLSLFPWTLNRDGINWLDSTEISITTFLAFISLQWWSFRRSDGGGEFIQRLLATKDEKQATLAGIIFLIVNYLIRSWLWILVGLAALVLLPSQTDWELSYPNLAVTYLPPVGLGLVVVSMVAAFMSTVSTSINWGASYLAHDLYKRFLRPSAGPREMVLVGQFASILLLLIGVITALFSNSIGSMFRLVIAIGTGPGAVLVLRWFWWRINALAELSAMLSGFFIGLITSVSPYFMIEDFGTRLFFTTSFTAVIWLLTLLFTEPESDETLSKFVKQVKPPGPGWRKIRQKYNLDPVDSLLVLGSRFVLGSGILYGGLISIGAFLLHQESSGWIALFIAVSCVFLIKKTRLITK